jgi:hypothetical protein
MPWACISFISIFFVLHSPCLFLKDTFGDSVTTPPGIIPYYRLNHSIWSLSDNKEASRWVLPGLHPENHLETHRGSNECIKTPTKESPECLTNYPWHPRRGHYYKHSSLTWK